MPVNLATNAPVFQLPDTPRTMFTGLASPSRGARETSVWRVALAPQTPASAHSLDHEEIIVGLSGKAVAHIAGQAYAVGPGDTIIVPAGAAFSLANPYAHLFEAMVVLPVGARASLANGEWFVPPWTV